MKIDWRRRAWLIGWLVLTVMVAARPAVAITEKAAIKQFKTAAKTRLGLLKSALDAVRLTVIARGDAFNVATATGGFTVLGVQDLVDDLADFQATVEDALFDVAVDTAADGEAALVALADGGPAVPVPLAFANLPGGLPRQVRDAVAKLLTKTYRSVNKRLAKTSAAIARAGDATLFVELTPPRQLSFAFSDERHDAIRFDLALDLTVSASTTTPDETRLWIGGTTALDGQNLTVSAIPMIANAPGEDQQVTSGGRGRFLARLGDTVPLPRSNYLVGVTPGLGASASSSFAIR